MGLKDFAIDLMGPLYEPGRALFWKVFALDQKTSLAWVATFLVLAFLVWKREVRRTVSNAGLSFWRYVFPRSIYLHPSAVVDYQYFVVNKAVFLFAFGGLSLSAMAVADVLQPFLTGALGPSTWSGGTFAVNAASTLASMLAFDLAYFVAHLLMHKLPFMWEFHRVHHSAEVLTPVTNYREHPVDSLFQALFQGSFVGVVTAGFAWSFPQTELVTFAGVNLFYLPYYIAANLRHSHIGLSFGPTLSYVFCSPVQHQAHHGSRPEHIDVNFGIFLSVWDWMAGTLYIPRKGEEFVFGLSGEPGQDYPNLWRMYALPFTRAARAIVGRHESSSASSSTP